MSSLNGANQDLRHQNNHTHTHGVLGQGPYTHPWLFTSHKYPVASPTVEMFTQPFWVTCGYDPLPCLTLSKQKSLEVDDCELKFDREHGLLKTLAIAEQPELQGVVVSY